MNFHLWLENVEKVELSSAQKATRQRKKNAGVSNLSKNLDRLTKQISKDLKSDDESIRLTAAAVKTMLDTSERVGNQTSEKNDHHGITGLKKQHISQNNGSLKLKYVGKSGMSHEKEVKDKRVVQALNKSGGNLFKTKEGKKITNLMVNDYLSDFNVTSKDIRGYNANKFMYQRLSALSIKDEKDRKAKFLEILKDVAEKVGHTPSMLRNSYLHQDVEDNFIKYGKVKKP